MPPVLLAPQSSINYLLIYLLIFAAFKIAGCNSKGLISQDNFTEIFSSITVIFTTITGSRVVELVEKEVESSQRQMSSYSHNRTDRVQCVTELKTVRKSKSINFLHNFDKCWPIVQSSFIFGLGSNLQKKQNKIKTLNTSLYYAAKLIFLKFVAYLLLILYYYFGHLSPLINSHLNYPVVSTVTDRQLRKVVNADLFVLAAAVQTICSL